MHHHREEMLAVGIAEIIGVIDAATTIVIRVYKNNNVFVGSACQHIMKALQMERCQITVAVEGVKVRAEYCVLPDTLGRFAGT